MEQKNKTFNLNEMLQGFFIGSFGVIHFMDIATTLFAKYTKTIFNESNILMHMGIPFYGVIFLKILVVFSIIFSLTRWNVKLSMTIRYVFCYLLVISAIMTATAVDGNIDYINTPDEQLVQYEPEVLKEYYKQEFIEMGAMEELSPNNLPSSYGLFFLNLFQFWVFKVFHDGAERKRRTNQVPV